MQDERGPLGRGESLQHYEHRHPNAVVERDAVCGIVGLSVDHRFGKPRPRVGLALGSSGAELIQTQAGRDHDEPAAHVLDLIRVLLQETGERLLNDVLGVADAPQHPIRDVQHVPAVVPPRLGESGFVRGVVADEQRPTALERWIAHELADRRALVEAGRLDLYDRFAAQDFYRAGRLLRYDCADDGKDRLLFVGRQSIVDGQRIVLVLDEDAAPEVGDCREPQPDVVVERRGGEAGSAAIGAKPHFRAVAADRGQLQRQEDAVEISEPP